MMYGSRNTGMTKILNLNMNKVMNKVSVLIFLAALSLFTVQASAQGKYGKDSVECTRNLSFYNDYVKQGNLNEAAPLWREALRYCPPGVSQKLYVDGQSIMKFLIEKNKGNATLKNSLIDSLIMMYDLRTQYFPKYALGAQTNKVIDIVNLKSDDSYVFDALQKNMNTFGSSTEPRILVIAMQKASELYGKKTIDAEKVMNLYSQISPIVENQIKANHPDAAQAKKDIDNLFAVSGVASCENIVALFEPKFKATPEDKELVSGIVKLLNDGSCFQEPLFLSAVESLYKMDPTYQSAYYLYKLYSIKDDHENAVKMLQQAIDSDQSTAKEDAEYSYLLASYYLGKLDNSAKAVVAAKQAMELDPSYTGKVYMLLGSVWASVRCGGNEVEQRAKWWVAVDYFMKAKNADSSLTEEADRFISTYRQYFPLQEEAFMYDIVDGASFTVSCGGMRESTTVRTRK